MKKKTPQGLTVYEKKTWIWHQTPFSFVLAGLKVTRETVLITRANDDIYSLWNSLRAKGGGWRVWGLGGGSAPAATTSDVPVKQISRWKWVNDNSGGGAAPSLPSSVKAFSPLMEASDRVQPAHWRSQAAPDPPRGVPPNLPCQKQGQTPWRRPAFRSAGRPGMN